MNDIQYLNEHIAPGIIGQFLTTLAFASALFSAIMYYVQAQSNEQSYRTWARWGFRIHAFSIFGMVLTILFILFNHYYEYKYAWEHLNNAMPMQYVFSCLWEGQEGSFLLWTFWHAVIGLLLMRWAKEWEPRVMAILSVVQVFLASMMLGVYFGDFQFGSSLFTLLREHPSNVGLPWTKIPEYLTLSSFSDGKGLNPLLQNYWMTIHPPMLFLGFASTVIPFLYAIAGLWKGDMRSWTKPAIPYAFFGIMILGTGILMGGAWAYEALGFGGFWAWDPVENASLVPWLVLVAGAHLLVVTLKKGTSVFAALILNISPFILVLYSTFLTRSGVLGDSSVHSFVDSGILAQLLVYLLFFTALATWLMLPKGKYRMAYLALCGILFLLAMGNLITYSTTLSHDELAKLLPGEDTWIPALTLIFLVMSLVALAISYFTTFREKQAEEESLLSREFWMFIGALILVLASIHITFVTSINVGNIFLTPFSNFFAWLYESTGWDWALGFSKHQYTAPGGDERFFMYHRIQVPLTFILMTVIAIGQFLKYKNTPGTAFRKQLTLSFIVSIGLLCLMLTMVDFKTQDFPLWALAWSSLFALTANADYLWRVLKGKFDLMGASVAHMGFALVIFGALYSTWQSHFISRNQRGNVAQLNKEFNNNEDMILLLGDTLPMGEYAVHYKEKVKRGERVFCTVEYFDLKPRTYKEGDYVQVFGQPFRALKSHTASSQFLKDATEDKFWTEVSPAELSEEQTENLPEWSPGVAGDRLFVLEPTILMSKKGNSREPAIRHHLGHDLYTFIKHTDVEDLMPKEAKTNEANAYSEAKKAEVGLNQQIHITESITLVLDSMATIDSIPENLPEGLSGKRVYGTMTDGVKSEQLTFFMINLKDGTPFPWEVASQTFKVKMELAMVAEKMELTAKLHKSLERDMLILTAEIFPQINVLWLGCLIMVIGSTMAIRHRMRINQRSKASDLNVPSDDASMK